ncbi:MAG: TRAP transporter small permease [Clostridia bacterium]|nr:TRAP transporter small permease [Clostridia bacterium]
MNKKKLGILDWFMVIMFAASVICVILQVFFRYVLNDSLTWTNEVSRYSFLWVVFVGTAVALKEGDHIVIDIVLTSSKPKMRNIILLIDYILICALTAALTVLGIELVISTRGSLSSALRLPINLILYMGLPIGMFLTMIVSIGKIIKQVKLVFKVGQPDKLIDGTKEDDKSC